MEGLRKALEEGTLTAFVEEFYAKRGKTVPELAD